MDTDVTQEVKLLDLEALTLRIFFPPNWANDDPVERCKAFFEVVNAAMCRDHSYAPIGLAKTWPKACAMLAEIAIENGVPVATINFLAAVHLRR